MLWAPSCYLNLFLHISKPYSILSLRYLEYLGKEEGKVKYWDIEDVTVLIIYGIFSVHRKPTYPFVSICHVPQICDLW